SSAAQTAPAAAVATGLPRSVITDAATSKPTDRCATAHDMVAVSSLVSNPCVLTAITNAVRTVSSAATRIEAAMYRWGESRRAARMKAAMMRPVTNVAGVATTAMASQTAS